MAKGKKALQEESYNAIFTINYELGEGGNAKVYSAMPKKGGKEIALKTLLNRKTECEIRFKEEISVMINWGAKVKGIIPIFTHDIKNCWYSITIVPVFKTGA